MKAQLVIAPALLTALVVSAIADDIKSSIKVGLFESEHKAYKEAKVPMIRAIEVAKTKAEGQVIKAKLQEEDGYLIYEIKIIDPKDHEREVIIDPVTEAILKVDKDD